MIVTLFCLGYLITMLAVFLALLVRQNKRDDNDALNLDGAYLIKRLDQEKKKTAITFLEYLVHEGEEE
ncbi:MAG TPA: hypothetical protein PKW33_15445 [Anaerolineaceae bacterium]|nr:hypothetical protein [Anaerolineaceae bacterium]HPN52989.1 hypothetical protein [Anaerolineaceae bacterium]